jgi:predicted DNA-binding protein
MKEKNTEYTGFRHPPRLGDRLEHIAETEGRSTADIIRRALELYVYYWTDPKKASS